MSGEHGQRDPELAARSSVPATSTAFRHRRQLVHRRRPRRRSGRSGDPRPASARRRAISCAVVVQRFRAAAMLSSLSAMSASNTARRSVAQRLKSRQSSRGAPSSSQMIGISTPRRHRGRARPGPRRRSGRPARPGRLHERGGAIGRLRGERRADQPAQPLVVVALGGQDRRPSATKRSSVTPCRSRAAALCHRWSRRTATMSSWSGTMYPSGARISQCSDSQGRRAPPRRRRCSASSSITGRSSSATGVGIGGNLLSAAVPPRCGREDG